VRPTDRVAADGAAVLRPYREGVNTFQQDIDEYETWLRAHCKVVKSDLKEKHRRMRKNVFMFLRATYFRWARTIESVCPELAAAPVVACIGDVHVANFGTWRDADGRLVWGINDYDEAAFMPYAFDLVRLATSACLSPPASADDATVVAAVLAGYRAGLAEPRAVLLDQHAGWLRPFADPSERTSLDFWRDVDACPEADPPRAVRAALALSLPDEPTKVRFASQTKGGGSLGRPLGVDDQLQLSGVVAEIDEDEAAVVATGRDPTGERLARADVLLAKLAAHDVPPGHADSLPTTSAKASGSSAWPGRRSTALCEPTTSVAAAPRRAACVCWPLSERPA